MDLSVDSGKLPARTAIGGCDLEQALSLSYTPRQAESRGAISLQVLEFKTLLLEAVEELHIQRDAEIRYEEHISKLVLEKQELDWQQESLQHQIEAMSNQHTEALASVKKQFQAKIRGVEEEKGKHQLHAESKDKEIKSLKEELKLLQLSTYSLEKKASELEQKLTLQSRSKDSLLNQLGEVEKRFGALSRLCAVVKQDHENLELNVDEAMRINTKLTSMKEKHESTITSLKLELEELNNKLMKTKLWSVVHTESNSHSAREQHAQQLQQRLLMETELNKKLMDENATERAQKQDLMRLLQHAQQLLLSQTQVVSGAELELQKHRQVYQALKREHEVMRERSEASEDRVARLTEDCASSKTLWEKEKTMFLERFKCEQQHLHALREAFDQLHQKHTELSSQAILHTQHVHGQEKGLKDLTKESQSSNTENREGSSENNTTENCVVNTDHPAMESNPNMENINMTERSSEVVFTVDLVSSHTAVSQIRDHSRPHRVSTLMSAVAEGTIGEGPLNELNPSSELPSLCSLQDLVPSQTRDPDCLVVTEAVDKLAATGATEEQEGFKDHQPPCIESPIHSTLSNTLTLTLTPPSTTDLISLHTLSEADSLNPYIPNPNTSESHPAPLSDFIDDDVCMCDAGSCVSVSVSGPQSRSVYEATDIITELLTERGKDGENRISDKPEEQGEGGVKGGGKDGKKEGRNGEQGGRCSRAEAYRVDLKDGGNSGEERGRLVTKTLGGGGEVLTEDAGGTKKAETETKDGLEGERRGGEQGGRIDREEEGGRLVAHTPETEIPAQTSAERSNTPQGIDPLDTTEPPLSASQSSDRSHTLSQRVTGTDADTSHVKEAHRIETIRHRLQTLTNDEVQPLTYEDQPLGIEVQYLSHPGVHDFTRDVESLNVLPATVQRVTDGKIRDLSTSQNIEDCSSLPSEPLNQSQMFSSQACAALSATQSDSIVNSKGFETSDTQLQHSSLTDSTINTKETEEKYDKPVSEECITVSQESSKQENEALTCMAIDSSQSQVNLCEKDACEIAVQPTGETSWSDSRRVYESCVGIGVKNVGPLRSQASPSSDMGPCTTNTPAEEEISGHQQHTEDARLTPNEKVLKLLNPSCHENDASPEILKHPPAKEHLFGDIDYSCLSSNKNYRFSFEWVSAQRRKVPPESEVNTRGSAGFPGWSSPRTIPTFLKGKQNRDPSVISRASDLLSASSVSGLPSSTKRDQRGEWKAIRETFRETASGVTESRASLSISSAPISTSSSTTGRLSWPSASGTLTPAPGPCPGSGSGSDWFPSISQEGEDQLSSFRAQISKIEQFLCAERPRLPKRQRTDD